MLQPTTVANHTASNAARNIPGAMWVGGVSQPPVFQQELHHNTPPTCMGDGGGVTDARLQQLAGTAAPTPGAASLG
jgi:hypothetical protein